MRNSGDVRLAGSFRCEGRRFYHYVVRVLVDHLKSINRLALRLGRYLLERSFCKPLYAI